MLSTLGQIRYQVELIEEAMKAAGIWSETTPDWVYQYPGGPIPDIWQWLQFVYLPMRLEGFSNPHPYLAPQIRPFLNSEITENSLLIQRIIELDSLSSTISASY